MDIVVLQYHYTIHWVILSPAAPKARDGDIETHPTRPSVTLLYFLKTLQVRAPCHRGVLCSL